MAITTNPCSFDCNPCVCPPKEGEGCLPEFRATRPCFFRGQVLGADDINAIVEYTRVHDLVLSRLLAGWGVLGGLRVVAPSASPTNLIGQGSLGTLAPNPQVIQGTVVQITAGAAIDAWGRKLLLPEPVTLDLSQLEGDKALVTDTCAALVGPSCSGSIIVTGEAAYLVAEFGEEATDPAPQVLGGCAQDAPAGCRNSRKNETVRFRLVPTLSAAYQFTGCLDTEPFTLPDVPVGSVGNPDLCRNEVFAFIDNVQGQLLQTCCDEPAIVLGRVIITDAPGALKGGLPTVPTYTIISDAYPHRRVSFQSALFTRFFPNLICGAP